jgi:hypothetical protein
VYTIKARYYSSPDQFGESFVITSDNGDKDINMQPGTKIRIVPVCHCGKDADGNFEGTEYLCESCLFERALGRNE